MACRWSLFGFSVHARNEWHIDGVCLVSAFMRETSGMSMEFVEASRYKKLEMTLLSGLPNEVDFAMNTCTLLSNKGRHTLQLKETPRLLELLLAHVGIYRDGQSTYLEYTTHSAAMAYFYQLYVPN